MALFIGAHSNVGRPWGYVEPRPAFPVSPGFSDVGGSVLSKQSAAATVAGSVMLAVGDPPPA